MAAQELPPHIGELLMERGAVVFFGPGYLDNSVKLIEQMKETLDFTTFMSFEKIGDLIIPDGPVLNCTMVFFHRKPPHMDHGAWDTALLQGIDLRAFPPRRLGVPDKTPEEPMVELAPAGSEMQLVLSWLRPLESAHIVRVARAIERSYVDNGGLY